MPGTTEIAQHISMLQKHATVSAHGVENKMQMGNTVSSEYKYNESGTGTQWKMFIPEGY